MHWYIVASQKEVRIFKKGLDTEQVNLFKTLKNPLAGVTRRELLRKEAGHAVKSLGASGCVRYSQTKRHDPQESAINQFAQAIVNCLRHEQLKNHFNSLTVYAEPHLLGKLRSQMSSQLRRTVTSWIKKDLQKIPSKKLNEILLSSKIINRDVYVV